MAEKLNRKWICCDTSEEYLKGAMGRFIGNTPKIDSTIMAYSVYKPGYLWDEIPNDLLDPTGGEKRTKKWE